MIRLVLFDAMHTLLTTAVPVGERYAAVFAPHLGHLDPAAVDSAFKHAIERVKQQQPLLRKQDTKRWWQIVIRDTALDAGADPSRVHNSLPQIHTDLMAAYNDSETSYKLYDDVIPTLQKLTAMNIRSGVVTNTDSRIRSALKDLAILRFLDPVVVSQEEGVEKPNSEIWRRAAERAGVPLANIVHVGDHPQRDFEGAKAAGLHALLLQRDAGAVNGAAGEISNLEAVAGWVREQNEGSSSSV